MDRQFPLRFLYETANCQSARGVFDMPTSHRLRSVSGVVLASTAALLSLGCDTTKTRSCTWTDANGKQQSVVAVESQSAKADVASIEALAGVARSVIIGAPVAGQPATRTTAQPAPTLPDLCARMFQ